MFIYESQIAQVLREAIGAALVCINKPLKVWYKQSIIITTKNVFFLLNLIAWAWFIDNEFSCLFYRIDLFTRWRVIKRDNVKSVKRKKNFIWN